MPPKVKISKEDIIKVKGVSEANADEIIKYFNNFATYLHLFSPLFIYL